MQYLNSKKGLFLVLLCLCLGLLSLVSQAKLLLAQESQTANPYGRAFLDNIRQELRATQNDMYDTEGNIREAGKHAEHAHEKVLTLTEQVKVMDETIASKENLIQSVSVQITKKENELILLYKDMELKEVEMSHQKQMLLDYLQVLYERESSVADTMRNNEAINMAKLLLSDEPAGDQLTEIRYFNVLEEQGHEIFNHLEDLKTQLEATEKGLEKEKEQLSSLETRLAEERNQLEMQKRAKIVLLERTKGEESLYRELLAQTEQQHEQLQKDVAELRENIAYVEQKMRVLGDAFDPNDYRHLFSGDKSSVYSFINATKDDGTVVLLGWPVNPARGITAYFRDKAYASYFGVPHNAIDIRAPQETPIRAPADGVVYKVRDNGMGYSYLMVAHKGGLMTLYGHVSGFFVEAGEHVYAGQTIALSGGMPGTKGAGLMTTGPHLHFEVLKGGFHVDPMNYLDLSLLDYDSIPEEYDRAKVRRPGEMNATDSF